MIKIVGRLRALPRLATAAMLLCLAAVTAAPAADPIRIGFSVALTGAVAPNGKQVLLAIQVWKDGHQRQGRVARTACRTRLLRRSEQSIAHSGHLHQAD